MKDEERQAHYERAENLLGEQNFTAALVAGGVTTLMAAVAYGLAVSAWAYAYGFAAAGVGIVIGLTIGFLGRGIATRFGVLAGACTVISCLLGNLVRLVMEISQQSSAWPAEVLEGESLPGLLEQSLSGFSAVDLVYLLIAVFAAVFFAKRPLSRADRLALGLYAMRDET